MTTYADPERCPDCRSQISYGAGSCPHCGLALLGDTAARLFGTLAEADGLLAELRGASGPVEATPAPGAPPAAGQAGPLQRASTGLSAASVPKILLGLGAGCLLVAAIVFLAVTWSVLGVGGRTAVLVGLTCAAGAAAALLARKELRAGAESLSLVALGLVTLDLFGARDAGWLGDISGSGFAVLLGSVLAVAGSAAGVAVRRTPVPRLVGAEVVAAVGVGAAVLGIVGGTWFADSASLLVSVLLAVTAAWVLDRLSLLTAAAGSAFVAGVGWLGLSLSSVERALVNPTAGELWGELEAWPLVASALLAGALAAPRRLPLPARISGAAVALLLIGFVLVLPFTLDTLTEATLAVLVLLVGAGAATWLAPRPWSWASAVTVAVAASWVGAVGVGLAGLALDRLVDTGAALWSASATDRLPPVYGGPAPWLLPAAALALLGAAVVLARAVPVVDPLVTRLVDPPAAAAVLVAAAVATSGLYPSPVWLVVGLFLLAAVGFVAWAFAAGRRSSALAAGLLLAFAALVPSLATEATTAGVLAVAAALCGLVYLRWPVAEVCAAAGGLFAGAVAGSFWTWSAILDLDESWTVLAALVVLGGITLGVRGPGRFGVEVGAAAGALVLAAVGVDAAAYPLQASWTAVYLTAAGVVASALALLRGDRRVVGWLGGFLLAAATWVRLSDLGVETPEAYTLPSALALVAVGLAHLRRNPGASTMTALAGGLGLGLVPSLLWVLAEPATLRAVLLGMACLALILLGLQVRWTAPVVFGSAVGAVLVLRHIAPIRDAVPQWLLIGLAGMVLLGLGVTWERRLREARAMLGYVRALR